LEFTPLAKLTGSINLGQGFPNWAPPEFVQKAASESALGKDYSTYARSAGHMNLVNEICYQYSQTLKRDLTPENVLVTVGATQGLYLSIQAFVEEGDEVIVIEPAFDIYYGALEMVKAKIIPIPLKSAAHIQSSKDLQLDWEAIKSKLNKKTKAIIINTPQNPCGKCISKAEIQQLATLLEPYPDCIVISDEVYEHLIFEHQEHTALASVGSLYDRCLSVYSAGKTFSVTGWKIGWVVGPKILMQKLQYLQQWMVFSVGTPLQEAVARALKSARQAFEKFDDYYAWFRDFYSHKRSLLFQGLKELGFNPILPQSGFFILSDIKGIEFEAPVMDKIIQWDKTGELSLDYNTLELKDYQLARYLCLEYGVVTIPMSSFHLNKNNKQAQQWIRFAFCKEDQSIEEALNKLKGFNK
jgi:kynurenine--oxoglutarate transaminase/cysteine-S-conjugate beta-lyase/glutamine--phenylpyruvate transaminase